MIIFLSLSLILFIFIGFDFILLFCEWQSRIHIGRWNNRLKWQNSIESTARKWIRKPPTVKLTDNNHWVLCDILRGQYRNRTVQSWQAAGLLLGLGKDESLRYTNQVTDAATGDWKKRPTQIDEVLLAYVLKKNGSLPPKAEETIRAILENAKGKQQTIPYRTSIPDVRFVDTIGMVVPFLFLSGEKHLAINQLNEYDSAKLPDSSIPSHAYDIVRNIPMGIYDWGRGIGWYILGLVESNTDGSLNERVMVLAEELMPYQKDDGGFGAMFFNKDTACDSSATALFGLLMLHAYRISLDSVFLDAAFRAESRLMKSTRRNGAVDFCQGDTKDIGHYSSTFSIMPFAQGITLMLSKGLNAYAHG